MLRLVDRLIGEGQSPTHFARQMVRFLRNAVVAKVAGGDSSLLQISSDERQRVVRVAELFCEEDLARHLQIMLRTHGELGYRQEQRFHLELGLLKMAHAQRLLPIEQLLSDAARCKPGCARRGQARSRTCNSSGRKRRRCRDPRRFRRLPRIRRARAAPNPNSPPEAARSQDPRSRCGAPPRHVVMGSAAPAMVAEPVAGTRSRNRQPVSARARA